MPSTVYKGDLAEVAFAPETGMRVEKNVGTSVTIVSSNSGVTLTIDGTATNDYADIRIAGVRVTRNQARYSGAFDAPANSPFPLTA